MRKIALALCLIVFFFAGFKVVTILIENHKEKVYLGELSRLQPKDVEVETLKKSYSNLKEVNADYIGFLEVKGTKIATPVVQSRDNAEYLTLDFYKKYSRIGIPFKDARSTDFSVIYGHHTDTDVLFSDLLLYKEEAFFNTNDILTFYKEDIAELYQIVAVAHTIDTWLESYVVAGVNKELMLQEVLDVATYQREVSEFEELLILSTCFTYTPTEERWLLIAIKI